MRLRRAGPAQPRQGVSDSCTAAPSSAACMCMRARCRSRTFQDFELVAKHCKAAMTMRGVLLAASISLAAPAGAAFAGPFEDAEAALTRGDYAAALQLLHPLAAEGHTAAQANLGIALPIRAGHCAELCGSLEVVSHRRRQGLWPGAEQSRHHVSEWLWRSAELRGSGEVVSPRRRPRLCRSTNTTSAICIRKAWAFRRTTSRP